MTRNLVQVDLLWTRYRCHGRWKRTTLRPHRQRGEEIMYGQLLDDRRWYVKVIADEGDQSYPVPDKATALRQVASWMRRLEGEWEQIECYPTHGWRDGERGQAMPGRTPGSAG